MKPRARTQTLSMTSSGMSLPLKVTWNLQKTANFALIAETRRVILSDNIPSKLKAHGQPRMTNHSKRKGDYKAFYTILKRRGLWRDPVYLQRKEALGCYVEDVREVMPICVVGNVRKRWPNPDGVPYCGHRRS